LGRALAAIKDVDVASSSFFLINLKGAGVKKTHCEDLYPGGVVYISLLCSLIQKYTVISRKVVGKNVHTTIPKGNGGAPRVGGTP